MPRVAILLLLLTAGACFGQVAITPQGFATTPGPAVPATPVSPPILYPPVVRLEQPVSQMQQPWQATPENAGVSPEVLFAPPPVAPVVVPANAQGQRTPFNFGAAEFRAGSAESQNDLSLVEAAKMARAKAPNANVRTFTNADIERIQPSNPNSGTNAPANANKSWPENNGVITPNNQDPQPAVAAPQNPNTQPPAGPFSPKSESGNQSQPPQTNPPQAELKSSGEMVLAASRAPVLAQDAAGQTNPNPSGNELPSSASRLPLIGVLGLVSVSTGFFVRYQRSKTK